MKDFDSVTVELDESSGMVWVTVLVSILSFVEDGNEWIGSATPRSRDVRVRNDELLTKTIQYNEKKSESP